MHRDADGYTSVRMGVDPLNAVTTMEFAKVGQEVGRSVSWGR